MSEGGVATFRDKIVATELDISGNADIDGTLEADAITVNGVALASVIAGTTVILAAVAATVSVSDNESTVENDYIPFVSGGAGAEGNVTLESDGDFHYNPSSGIVTATAFAGNLTGNVTGNASGTALTVTQAAQSAITSVGTLTAVTVTGLITANGGIETDTNSKVVQKGAFMQSSTHQALTLGG